MEKDSRYLTVKLLAEAGRITEIRQIFDYIPEGIVAKQVGISPKRFSRLVQQADEFAVKELVTMAGFFEIGTALMLDLACNQYINDQKDFNDPTPGE